MNKLSDLKDSVLYPKAVVVLAGARDNYQLPLALHEEDLLQSLVTDFYWPLDSEWLSSPLRHLLPRRLISARYCTGLTSKKVSVSQSAFGASALMKATSNFRLNRFKDKTLSRKARLVALRNEAPLFSYSYYASEAFKPGGELPERRFIFQLHPHPKSVRHILLEEMERVPEASNSLKREAEISLSSEDFDRLAAEPHLANGWVVASTYTARTLSDHGIPADQIHVVPYGVDSSEFPMRLAPPSREAFTIIYVGSLSQRKGLSYLLDAARLLKSRSVRVVLCGRGLIDRRLINQYADLNLEVIAGLSRQELVRQIHKADVFVLPSLAEGFAHVILEVMSCGLPVITTSHTCAPDVIEEAKHGFIVPVRDSEAVAKKLAWGMDNRSELAEMGKAASARAKTFTWGRFREGIREAYRKMISSSRSRVAV